MPSPPPSIRERVPLNGRRLMHVGISIYYDRYPRGTRLGTTRWSCQIVMLRNYLGPSNLDSQDSPRAITLISVSQDSCFFREIGRRGNLSWRKNFYPANKFLRTDWSVELDLRGKLDLILTNCEQDFTIFFASSILVFKFQLGKIDQKYALEIFHA